MSDAICKKCCWFEQMEHEMGECRSRPPVIIEKLVGGSSNSNIFQASKHPLVSAHHWCAAFHGGDSARGAHHQDQ